MKLGGRDEITNAQAIAELAIVTIVCLLLSFWEPFKVLGRIFASVAGVSIFILWQIDLNIALRQSRSDSESAKTVWNIFQTVDETQEEEKK
jgi:hypothetical protein